MYGFVLFWSLYNTYKGKQHNYFLSEMNKKRQKNRKLHKIREKCKSKPTSLWTHRDILTELLSTKKGLCRLFEVISRLVMLLVVVELVARGSLGAPLERIGRLLNPLKTWFMYGFFISPSLPVLEIFFENLLTKW